LHTLFLLREDYPETLQAMGLLEIPGLLGGQVTLALRGILAMLVQQAILAMLAQPLRVFVNRFPEETQVQGEAQETAVQVVQQVIPAIQEQVAQGVVEEQPAQAVGQQIWGVFVLVHFQDPSIALVVVVAAQVQELVPPDHLETIPVPQGQAAVVAVGPENVTREEMR
jgi:hypothetical protein